MFLGTRYDLERVATELQKCPIRAAQKGGKRIAVVLDWRAGSIKKSIVENDPNRPKFTFGELVLYYPAPMARGLAYVCKNPRSIESLERDYLKGLQLTLVQKVVPVKLDYIE